jgi:hypothetical protein
VRARGFPNEQTSFLTLPLAVFVCFLVTASKEKGVFCYRVPLRQTTTITTAITVIATREKAVVSLFNIVPKTPHVFGYKRVKSLSFSKDMSESVIDRAILPDGSFIEKNEKEHLHRSRRSAIWGLRRQEIFHAADPHPPRFPTDPRSFIPSPCLSPNSFYVLVHQYLFKRFIFSFF